jgi:hypothetical protein
MSDLEQRVAGILRDSPTMMQVMRALRADGLADWRIFAGAVYQTVWNRLSGREPDFGVRDYDVIYFDPDTSWEAEDVAIRRVAEALPAELRERVEVRNQARVHLWFEDKFQRPYAPLISVDDALLRAVATVHGVSVRLDDDDEVRVSAPLGLTDLFEMRFRAGPGGQDRSVVDRKAAEACRRWPGVVYDTRDWTGDVV